MSTPITRARFDEICLHFAEQYLISRDLAQDATEEAPHGQG